MSKENKSKYAILGVLSYGPMSGYAIKKFIQQSISNFWNESYGQIYPILKQLTSEGLASSHAEKQEGKPERYMYTLTGKGWEALQQWLTEPAEHLVGRVGSCSSCSLVETPQSLLTSSTCSNSGPCRCNFFTSTPRSKSTSMQIAATRPNASTC